MIDPNIEIKIERLALLDTGRIVEYTVCSRDIIGIKDSNYRFVGRGTIFKINGLAANDTSPKFFWIKKETK
jgi:hypothetical protein